MEHEHGFEDFWAIYPISRSKKDARKAWQQMKPTPAKVARLMAGLRDQIADHETKAARGQWVPAWPYPATWIRGERWEDLPFHAPPPINGRQLNANTDQRQKMDEMKRLIAHEGLTVAEAARRVGYR